jgi:hypothetical protein
MIGAIVFFLVILSVLFASLVCTRSQRASFKERFAPLSDAEFVARCAPGTNASVALKVRKVLAEALNVEYERIHPSSRLMQDLGAE